MDLDAASAETSDATVRKLRKAVEEFQTYIEHNAGFIPNYGERRTNATHASTTDPEARLYKKAKGQEAKLCYLGHVRMENRHGLVVDTRVTQATGTVEREAALAMAAAGHLGGGQEL